jgi:Bacteriophage related domain of unknown function
MASKAISDVIQTHQAGEWTTTPVYYPNDAVRPPTDGSAFTVVEYPIGQAETLTIDGRYWETGTIRFIVHVPLRDGPDNGLTYAGELGAVFSNERLTFTGGYVKFGFPSSPISLGDDGAFYRFSTSIPFFSFVS